MIVAALARHFGLQGGFVRLIDLLILHKRGILLAPIIRQLKSWYYKHNNIQIFDVSVSHQLSQVDEQRIIDFIKQATKSPVIHANFKIAEKLISGVRIQSDYFLWERSISKLLRQVKQQMLQQVG